MANMTFGTNILPASGNDSLSLGNSEQRWNVYGEVNGDVNGIASNVATTADTANDLYLLGVTSGATTAVKRNTDAVLGDSNLSLKNENAGSTDVSLCVDVSGKNGIYVNGYYNGSSFVSDPKWLIVRNKDGNTYLAAGAVVVNNGDFKIQNGNAAIRRKLSQWPALHFSGGNTETLSSAVHGSIYYDCATTSSTRASKFMLRELSTNSTTGEALTSWEDYWLPDCDADRTSNKTYNILTTKNAVTVAQGGTGATTAAQARTNLGAVNIAGDVMTGNLTIQGNLYPSVYLKPQSNNTTNVTVFEGSYLGASSFAAWEDGNGNNRRMLEVRTKSYESSLDNAVMVRVCDNGSWNNYRVFHAGMPTGVPVANGGTGATTAADAGNNLSLTQTVTLSVGSGLSAVFTRIGKIVNVFIPSIPTQTIAAWGTVNLCSIPSGYCSSNRNPYMVLPRQSATTYSPVFLVANGGSAKLALSNQSGSAQTTGVIMPMSFTWSLA